MIDSSPSLTKTPIRNPVHVHVNSLPDYEDRDRIYQQFTELLYKILF